MFTNNILKDENNNDFNLNIINQNVFKSKNDNKLKNNCLLDKNVFYSEKNLSLITEENKLNDNNDIESIKNDFNKQLEKYDESESQALNFLKNKRIRIDSNNFN